MDKLTKIKSAILKNNGATFTSNGKKAHIRNGYIVSEQAHGVIMSVKEFNDLTFKRFRAFLRKAQKLGALLGFWVNCDKVYIDFNKHISDKSEAIAYAHEQKQLAIWDCLNACEINTSK